MQNPTGVLELGKEYPPPGEDAVIAELERISVELLKRDYPANVRPARRDAHAKHHGCVKGKLSIEADLPIALKVGIFKEPRHYPALIRFSNGDRHAQDDTKGDTRGIAIKLLGVEGEKVLESEKHEQTQDFTLVNHPVFAIRDAQDYLELFQLLIKGGNKLKFFFPGINPRQWRLHEFKIATTINRKKIISPLEIQYWSMTPYQLGTGAAKFSVKPQVVGVAPKAIPKSPHYLHTAMVNHLATQEARFDFLVQLQTDPYRMPIEDPTIAWDEAVSPYQKVATLTIPPQAFDSPEQMAFCENLSYSPWHSLPEHKPLGGINRVRKHIYESIARLRHEMNNVPYQEPTDSTI
ncbi:catalase family protein [Oculatella sp. LEGE 06141]|uniref:catalase family protein n=1 Tax=Oculatella sp. LEGE 06141 TaxID=1828648 RepID=UPI0018828524|nr:catalase family protein [Oculatella sp. LEGE 06141]MBE9178382.1 catalase family protein [Oculatella sp. LEGE 06141]